MASKKPKNTEKKTRAAGKRAAQKKSPPRKSGVQATHVKADLGQIEQVLVNLSVNARDAMPLGGKLTIETCNVTLDENYASYRAEVSPGEYVLLAITDTGSGMPPEVLSRLFEPFFTRRRGGQGTGLGLSITYRIVEEHDGQIVPHSDGPGKGSRFTVSIPLRNAGARQRQKQAA